MINLTELFVMIIYYIGLPLFYGMIRSTKIPGANFFLLSYISLLLSNTFTVIEGLIYPVFFDTLEHLFIIFGALFLLFAVLKITQKTKSES